LFFYLNPFTNLDSSGLTLEKKGIKIIALTDVNQAITIFNLGIKDLKRIAIFSLSAGKGIAF
jgi:hypothetical protein